jgi:site-specific DNA-adenine methylase
MFSYYGSKSKLINLYPPPKYGKIIEPFAGSARYSLKYWDRDILLVDVYDVVIDTWKWLQQCSKQDILGLPDISKMEKGFDLKTLNLSKGETYFLGLNAAVASISPRFKISSFASEQHGTKTYLKRVADNIYKIKHWEIRLGSYTEINNGDFTWFIDPPYMVGGHAYKHSEINYSELAKWCQEREGQVIVCENTKANWLPFNPIIKSRGANQLKTTEAIWSNIPTSFDYQQTSLF